MAHSILLREISRPVLASGRRPPNLDSAKCDSRTRTDSKTENFKNFKAKEAKIEKQKEDLNVEFEKLKKELKQKQQLHRVSSYKLNELKRSIKTKMRD